MHILALFKKQIEELGYKIEIPPQEIEADLAVPVFKFNKLEVAEKIKSLTNPLIEDIKIVGAYINISLNKNLLAQKIIPQILGEKDRFGQSSNKENKKIIIEFSDPNVAKPLNVGHFRTTMIGQVLANLYRWQGYQVITINHLGDWGTQFGKLLVAYQKWGDQEKDLFKLYMKFHDELEKNPKLDEEARVAFKELETGSQEHYNIWKKITDDSIAHFNQIYNELNVNFDKIIGESFYLKMVPEVINEALEKGVAEKSEGAIVVSESKTNLPTFVIQKSDDSSIYASRDLAAAEYRLEKWDPEKIIYVVGSEQKLYFQQIFKTLELLGYDSNKFIHISLGLVILPEGKMSTRKGRVILLDDLLKEVLKKTNDNKIIGYGALIYNSLYSSPEKTVVFDWEKMLSLNGNSAPYIQYGYVRCRSILEKNGSLAIKQLGNYVITTKIESELVKQLAFFPEICQQAQQLNSPHLLANYLNNLVQNFNRFYATERVLEAEELIKNFRLQLVSATAQVIKNGLTLFNIEVPEKM